MPLTRKPRNLIFFSLNPLNRLLEVFWAELNFLAGIIFSQLNGLNFILKPPIRSLCKMIYLLISNSESILPKSLKMEISVINLSTLHERHHKKRPTLAKDFLFISKRAENIFLVVLIHLNLKHTHKCQMQVLKAKTQKPQISLNRQYEVLNLQWLKTETSSHSYKNINEVIFSWYITNGKY